MVQSLRGAEAPRPSRDGRQAAADSCDRRWGSRADAGALRAARTPDRKIINPLGVKVTGECVAAPPLTSWANAFDGGAGVRAGAALGYDWGALRLEGEYFQRVTVYGDQSDIDIFDDVTLDKQEQEIELAVGVVDDWRSHAG